MKFHEIESAAREATALAQAAERKSKAAAQNVKGVEKESHLAKLRLKRAKKEFKQAAAAARVARESADEARRVSAKASIHHTLETGVPIGRRWTSVGSGWAYG